MTPPFLLRVVSPVGRADPPGRLPANTSYRIAYAEAACWRGDGWWLSQQWHDARHVWLYLVEMRTRVPLRMEIELLQEDFHWLYILAGQVQCRHPHSNLPWVVAQDNHVHLWAQPAGVFVDITPGHHLYVGFSVEKGWPLRYAGAALSHLRTDDGERPAACQSTPPIPMNADIRSCLLTLASLSPAEGMLLDSRIYHPITRLIELTERTFERRGNENSAQRTLIDAVRDSINTAIQQDHPLPSVTEIARHFGVSGDHLSRIHRQHYGQSLQSYIMRRRLNEAYRLLQHERLSVSAVTYRLGFTDLSAFGKLFRKYFNKSPSEVRNR